MKIFCQDTHPEGLISHFGTWPRYVGQGVPSDSMVLALALLLLRRRLRPVGIGGGPGTHGKGPKYL